MSAPSLITRTLPDEKLVSAADPIRSTAASDLRVAWIDDVEQLAGIQAEWNALAGGIPFRSFTWLTTWWRHYRQSGDRLFVLTARNLRGELVGLAPLYQTVSLATGRLLRLLGSGRVASDHLTLLAAADEEHAVAAALAQWLVGQGSRHWQRMELVGVDAGDRTVEAFCRELSARASLIHRSCCVHCWSMPLTTDWEEFLKQLSKSRRNRVRRLFRELLTSGRGVIHRVQCESQLDRGFSILVNLHGRRRQSLGDTGCFVAPRFAEFHRDAMSQLLREGRLRLVWLEIDGVPAAVEYQMVGDRAAYMYQSGLNPDFDALRPGWLLKGITIQDAIAEGLHDFDFMRGDEPYKASWSATPQPVLEYRIVRRQPGAMLRHVAWLAKFHGKEIARRLLRGKRTATSGEDQS